MPIFTLGELAARTAAQLIGDPDLPISGVNTLDEAGPHDLSFLANNRYQEAMKRSAAGAVCATAACAADFPGKNYLVSPAPSQVFQHVVHLLLPSGISGFQGIHPTAVIHETAVIGNNVSIGPYVVIDRDVQIGDGTQIDAHVSIGFEAVIGSQCHLYPSSVVRERCRLGNRVILQPGAVIGSCGFGFLPDEAGRYQKLEQLGIVIIEDDVEIGANTTVDRSRFKATKISAGSKIDNLCQIAHNVEIGEHTVIAAQTGIAGSSKIGRRVMLGGQVGIVGHVQLSDGVMVSSQSGVSKSLIKSGPYRGTPAIPMQEYHHREVLVRKLEDFVERLKALEAKLSLYHSQEVN